jgi:hypothetical protein
MIGNTISPLSALLIQIILSKNIGVCLKSGKSLPFSINDIMKEILIKNSKSQIKENKIKELVNQLIDEFKFISNWGFDDLNNPLYILNFENIAEKIKSKTLEKLLGNEYSPMHLRIYRLLNKCGALDSKMVLKNL